MKKQIKKILAATLILGLMLSGCDSKEDFDSLLSKNEPVTVTIWHYYNGVQQSQLDEMVETFNNTVGSDKGIYVEARSKNSVGELAESVLSSVNKEPGAEEVPDIFATYVETAYQIDKQGALADLSTYLTEEEIDEYVDEYIEEGAFAGKGTLKIFPTAKSTEVMILNKTDWNKFAESESVSVKDLSTWEGLVRIAEKYYAYTDAKTPDVPNDGKAFFGRDSVANYMVVGAQQLGHSFVIQEKDGTTEVSSDKAVVRKLWENYYVPYVKGYFTAESRFRSDDAKIGSIIALVCSTTGASYYPQEVTINDDYTYPIENEVIPLPNFEGCDPYIVQQGAGMAVLKSDPKTEYACAVFLKWFTENEQNIRFAVNSGYLPVKKSANDIKTIASYEKDAQISSTMQNTFEVAIDEINSYTPYISAPFEHSAELRDFISVTMEETAKQGQADVKARVAAGEKRERVLQDYVGDEAFETWYATFEKGFAEIVGE